MSLDKLSKGIDLMTTFQNPMQDMISCLIGGAQAIIRFIAENPNRFAAIIVDYQEQEAGLYARRAGFTGPVIGLVSREEDRIEGADRDHNIRVAFGVEGLTLLEILDQLTDSPQ